jgi:putative alpha-1,2-mannosidase
MPAGTLKIRVERESPDSIYPECFSFNGREFREPWLKVGDVAKGGELVFRLSVKPSGRSPLPQWY